MGGGGLPEWHGLVNRVALPFFVLLFPLFAPPYFLHVDGQFPAIGAVLRPALRVLPLFLPRQRRLLFTGVGGFVAPLVVGGLSAPRFLHLVERRKRWRRRKV